MPACGITGLNIRMGQLWIASLKVQSLRVLDSLVTHQLTLVLHSTTSTYFKLPSGFMDTLKILYDTF